MRVRAAAEGDPAEIGRLRTALSAEYAALIPHLFQRAEGLEPTLGGDALWLVAEAEEGVVGFAYGLVQTSAPFPVLRTRTVFMLHEIGVDAAHRGRGVGSALLEGCLAWARERSVTEVELNVYAASPPALAFYRRHGFEVRAMRMARPTA